MKQFLYLLALVSTIQTAAQLQPVGSGVFHFTEAAPLRDSLRETRKFTEGTTAEFSFFKAHATTQFKGAVPRPAHAQKDIEELIIIKEGSMKCTTGSTTTTLGRGSVLLIPPGVLQLFEHTGEAPLTCYVFQFRSKNEMDITRSAGAGGTIIINADTLAYAEKNGKGTRSYFDRATAACERYEMHTTTLKHAGPSHAPHQHPETEIILLIEGTAAMTIDGRTYTGSAGDFFIAAGGTLHGLSNPEDKPCSYFAFKWR